MTAPRRSEDDRRLLAALVAEAADAPTIPPHGLYGMRFVRARDRLARRGLIEQHADGYYRLTPAGARADVEVPTR